jgi:hypothetical protein
MNEEKKLDSEKITKYLKVHEDLSDFIISRKVFKTLIWWASIYSLLLSLFIILGAKSYINNTMQSAIEIQISKQINEEILYLRKRNEISYMSDQIFSNGDVAAYEDLKKIENDIALNLKIRMAAKSESKRIELFFSSQISDEVYPPNNIVFIDKKGKTIRGGAIKTEDLLNIYNTTFDFGKKTTILYLLEGRKDKILPNFLYKIAKEASHLRIRYYSVVLLSNFFEDYPKNYYDYEYFKNKIEHL